MFSKPIYVGEKFAIFAPMKKELGKWFMDIAKYLLTAVVVGALISDIENSRWLVYVGGIGATLSMLVYWLGVTSADRNQ
jgi:hypothetical protein